MSLLAVFLSHVPGWFLCVGVFVPVSLLLLLLTHYLSMNLRQVEAELLEVRDPRETARRLCSNQHHRYRRRRDS